MAKLTSKGRVTLDNAQFTVNENELRALDALAGYGDDAFIKHFYEKLGRHYMEPHEAGLRSFLSTIRKEAGPALHEIDSARKALANHRRKEAGDG